VNFDLLTQELQNILSFQFSQSLKFFWIILLISFSLIYLFYIRQQEKKTVFWSVAIIRIILSAFSFVNLLSIPLLAFGLSPEWAGMDFILVYMMLYLTVLGVYVMLLVIDLLRYSVPVMLSMGGFNIDDDEGRKAYNKVKGWFKNGRG
jgi:hypothetical protein